MALMVAGGTLLGTLGVFVEEAGQHPLTTVWARCLFGALALGLWGAMTGRLGELRLRGAALRAAVLTGLLVVFNWALFFAAITRTSIGVATVVVHVQPLWVMALGAWWLGEPVSRRQGGGAVLALLGLALATGVADGWLTMDGAQRGAGASAWAPAYWTGVLMCLGGSFSYAVVTLVAKTAPGVSSFALAWWQCAVGALLLTPWPLLHGLPAAGPAWGWLMGLGAIHSGLAYVLLYAGMARLGTAQVALLQFVYPAVAVLVDWAVYGRTLSPVQLLGVALMAVALSATRRRP